MSGKTRICFSAISVLMILTTFQTQAAPPNDDVARRDWYFRESLSAIDDWEAILAHREANSPKDASRTPVLPVPTDGQIVEWPNPIPLALLPLKDHSAVVQLRVQGTNVEWRRLRSDDRQDKQDRFLSVDQIVAGYKHPGGGGRNQWYHSYERKFDSLTTLHPEPAPFAMQFERPWTSRKGENPIAISLRNVRDKPLDCEVRLQLFWRESSGAVAEKNVAQRKISLATAVGESLLFDVDLAVPGGGLLVVSIDVQGQSYWMPLLTYVEDVPAVLRGVEQILADDPDEDAAERLTQLRNRVARSGSVNPQALGEAWRQLFVEASELRDELLLSRIDFERMLLVKRKPFFSEQPFMDAHHCYNRPGGGIYSLSPVRPDGLLTPIVDSLAEGVYRDVCLNWDASRLVFSFGNGSDRAKPLPGETLGRVDATQNYNLYEVTVHGDGLSQLTSSPNNDCEPFYVPNGQIGFTSDRADQIVMCGSNIHVASLFTMGADGSGIRQLGFNVFNEFNPSVLPDGRIIYNRWEYNERSVTSLHDLFTIHPDGTHAAPYYGNATIRPNVVMFPRAVPGSNKIMALFTGHHGQTHGPLGLIDVARGLDGPSPVTVLTPGVPIIGEKIEDSRRGWFSDPRPLSETAFLCSHTPTVLPWLENSWAIYVGDQHGNLALVYRDPEISCAEPIPLVPRPRPAVLAPSPGGSDTIQADATLMLLDVYRGLTDVPRGTAKYLRILEDVPRIGVPTGGVICTSGTGIYTIKRVFGTVPIESDGSAHFTVPANRNLYFEVLDEGQREIQRMRSVVCLKPNEQRTCIGCHESRVQAPPNRSATASLRSPSHPAPPPWGTRTISYLRDVQPLLNDKCIRCHSHDRTSNHVILTDDLTDQFAISYEELLPFLSVANAMRWDHPDDVLPQAPYTYGSNRSQLMKLLLAGHHGVSLSDQQWQTLAIWIDTNAVYYDRYETYTNNRRIFTGTIDQKLRSVYAKRCVTCHADHDGRLGTWWRTMNRHDVRMSRALKAPLARSAGGWQRCGQIVFADESDPDFQRMLVALTELRDAMSRRPRADLLSLRGTPAERQQVKLPEPPEPSGDQGLRDWDYLSDLRWSSARAGWTHNQDGLPRRNRDVQNNALRAGPRAWPRGIGTHAPSEIVYSLDGRYQRCAATLYGAEANGTVVFKLFGDDKLLYESGVMHGLREVKKLDVSIKGVRRLKLVVTDAGDGYISDMANWADARLFRSPAKSPDEPE
ncbi:MAG: hypothetical protein GY903_27160 [Fuerstiella sp.]|nr:hypothetical protein [Fuerstiella sp.]MCP4858178.1 hypothetical protein [Fuerstiella sp.]